MTLENMTKPQTCVSLPVERRRIAFTFTRQGFESSTTELLKQTWEKVLSRGLCEGYMGYCMKMCGPEPYKWEVNNTLHFNRTLFDHSACFGRA